jgi:ATP-dependent DNA ligase
MTLPRVQPIAPTWRKEPFDDPDWLFDFKYDGFRALYYFEPGHNRLISRNGNLLTRFDALAGALAAELEVDADGVERPRPPAGSRTRCPGSHRSRSG